MTAAQQIRAAMIALTAARSAQLVDTGRAVRPASQSQTPDLDADGNVVGGEGTEVYSGPCVISNPGQVAQNVQTLNDDAGVPNARVLKLPIDSPALLPGDLFTVLTSLSSPGLVGDTFVVIGENERSYSTHRQYVVRGSSWLPSN